MQTVRVTVSFPPELVRGIDRVERNRSRFIQEAVRRELYRRQRDELHRSLRNPHPETRETSQLGFAEWSAQLAEEADLLDPDAGTEIRWQEDEGWHEGGR